MLQLNAFRVVLRLLDASRVDLHSGADPRVRRCRFETTAKRYVKDDDGTTSFKGYLDRDMPDDVRTWFEHRFHDEARMLHTKSERENGKTALWIAIVLSVVMAGILLFNARRARQRAA